jgi:hypothetical protein
MKNKIDKNEGILAIIAALLVLFTALVDPIYSIALSIILLIAFSVYKLAHK